MKTSFTISQFENFCYKFKSVDYVTKLDPEIARVLIKARLRMFEVKVNFKKKYNYKLNCPFCTDETETFDHIFQCPDGVFALSLSRV